MIGMNEVLMDVAAERLLQDERWGQQDHLDQDPNNPSDVRAQRAAETCKDQNARRVMAGTLAWDGILLEEVFEALAETDPARLRAELVQVAAVAVAWVEAIDRRPA